MLSCLIQYDQNKLLLTTATVVLVCQNIPDHPELCDATTHNHYQVSMNKMSELTPAMSARDIIGDLTHVSAANILMSTDPAQHRKAR